MAITKNAKDRKSIPYQLPENPRDIPRYNWSRLVDRKITEGREVVVSDFPDLMDGYSKLNWQAFLVQQGPIYPRHIREFYANFEFTKYRNINFRFRENTYFGSLLCAS